MTLSATKKIKNIGYSLYSPPCKRNIRNMIKRFRKKLETKNLALDLGLPSTPVYWDRPRTFRTHQLGPLGVCMCVCVCVFVKLPSLSL